MVVCFTSGATAKVRFWWNRGGFPHGPTRITYWAMGYLKSVNLVVVINEIWKTKGYGGFPQYNGEVVEWKAPSNAWDTGSVDQRRKLVVFGHDAHLDLESYGRSHQDILNMRCLGIIGARVPMYGLTLQERMDYDSNLDGQQ